MCLVTLERTARTPTGRMSARGGRVTAHVFDGKFYAKVAAVSFVVGAAFESVMLATDFYPKVLAIEAERRYNARKSGDDE